MQETHQTKVSASKQGGWATEYDWVRKHYVLNEFVTIEICDKLDVDLMLGSHSSKTVSFNVTTTRSLSFVLWKSLEPKTTSAFELRSIVMVKCVYRSSYPAIYNRVITITNINSLWNSCRLFMQYHPIESTRQSTELYHLHCYCSLFVCHSGSPTTPLPLNTQSSQCIYTLVIFLR